MKAARGGIHPGQRAGCSGGPGNFNFCFNNAVPFFPSDALPRSESDPFIKETHGALLMIAGIPLRDEAHVAAPAGGLEPEDRILFRFGKRVARRRAERIVERVQEKTGFLIKGMRGRTETRL